MSITYLEDQPDEYRVVVKKLTFPVKISRTGYGAKIRTDYCVRMRGNLHRVYATCYSNCASFWISVGGKKFHLSNADLDGL